MEQLIKRLKDSVDFAEISGENMDDVSWDMQEGLLISYNDAKIIIPALEEFKNSSKSIQIDILPCPFCGKKVFEGRTKNGMFTIKCYPCGIEMIQDRKDKVRGLWNMRSEN